MTAQLSPTPIFKGWANDGTPLAYGKLYTYAAGTTTHQATYVDSTQTTPNTNPIILNARGECPLWLAPNLGYKFSLFDLFGNQISGYPVDNIIQGASLPIDSINIHYDITPAETAAAVTPSNYSYLQLDPRRYGAIGDGTTDDTGALNQWVAVINAYSGANDGAGPVSNWPSGLNFLCQPLNTISANNLTWNAWATLLAKPNAGGGTGSLVTISGSGARLYGLELNGNQFAESAPSYAQSLLITGNDILMDGCSFIEASAHGLQITNSQFGRFSNCHFDSNAGVGIQTQAVSYLKFVNCTWNYNGYGFQKTWATNAFIGFGLALRFRSHHLTFTNCESLQNGRDGLNVNQGSYAIKFIGCLCWMNDDGGFTLAADNTGTGLPGEGESPYDVEYVDCEAYNNWSSGLAAYQAAINITISGGRYYNNHRCAGSVPDATSYNSGIFIAGGSIGVNIDTKAYDDRQLCPITAVSGSGANLTATQWGLGNNGGTTFIPTAANYPVVALYNSGMQFQGYAMITAEASGTVSITAAANNSVTLGSIASGWYVSQRVQHNGVMYDNGCQGEAHVDGFGQLPGIQSYYGWKLISGPLNNGQNVLLRKKTLDPNNELLLNPSFDSVITDWTYNLPGGGASNYYTGATRRSTGALQLIGGSSPASGDATMDANVVEYVANAFVEASMWVYATSPGDASITLLWMIGSTTLDSVVNHPGGGWLLLRIGGFMPSGLSNSWLRVTSAAGKTNYFDVGSFRVASPETDNRDYSYPTRNLPV